MKPILLMAACLFLLTSCGEDEKPEQDVAPSVTILKPVTTVKAGEKIPISLEFADDKGLKLVEISLGSEENSGVYYHYTTRGLSGRKDELSYMVDPPANMDITGSNYIFITCRDNGGNSTVADETFMVVDGDPPTGSFIFTDVVLEADTSSRAEVVYEAEDEQGLKKIVLEMWEVDAQDSKIKLMDFVQHEPAGAKDYLKQHFFKGKTSYTPGDRFKFFLKIYDDADNLTEVISGDTGVIQ